MPLTVPSIVIQMVSIWLSSSVAFAVSSMDASMPAAMPLIWFRPVTTLAASVVTSSGAGDCDPPPPPPPSSLLQPVMNRPARTRTTTHIARRIRVLTLNRGEPYAQHRDVKVSLT